MPSELSLYNSLINNDTGTNGGAVSTTEVINGSLNGIWPNISPSELVAGITRFRKLFRCNRNAANETLSNALVYNTATGADTYVRIFVGDDTNTQADLTGSEDRYGAGVATADIIASATAFSVTTEGPGGDIYRIGDTVIIRDDTASNFETAEILTVTVNTPTDTDLTITAGVSGTYTTAQNATVSSALPVGNLVAAASSVVVTSVGGTYDDVGSPIGAQNVGGIDDSWTLTFTDPTNYTVSGAAAGAVGGSAIGADFSPNNPATGTPYFTILAAGFGGAFLAADTITFTSTDSCAPFWAELIAPAGTAGQASPDSVGLCCYGE